MRVVVILDPSYGANENADLGDAFWLVASPLNRRLAASAWAAKATDPNSAVFNSFEDQEAEIEDRFEDVKSHHPTWTEVEFIGATVTDALARRFIDEGLSVDQREGGFVLRR